MRFGDIIYVIRESSDDTPEWLFHSLTKAEEWVAANSGGHYRYIISEVQFYPNEHKDERV